MDRLLNRPKDEIKDVNEKAFQRAIFHNETTHLPRIRGKRKEALVEWYDFESPIDKNRENNSLSRGEFNLDLIGHDTISNHFIICEVKFSCNKNDSPDSAAKEAYNYYQIIINNAVDLDNVATHHKGGRAFLWQDIDPDNSEIWIVANSAYWTYWLGCKGERIPEYVGEEGGYQKRVRCFSVDLPGSYFIDLKGDNKVYRPSIPKSVLWTELNLK